MSYSIKTIPKFDKKLKKLARKYPSIKGDFTSLIETLKENPKGGTSLGKNCYKIRMAITSKGTGKSGGARVITHILVDNKTVYLLSIYDKAETETLSNKELKELLDFIKL